MATLVTELEEALIPTTPESYRYLFNTNTPSSKHLFEYLSNELKPFLKNDNELAIVADPYTKDLTTFINTYIKEIYKSLKKYEDQITFYLSGDHSEKELLDLGMLSNHRLELLLKDIKPIVLIENKKDVFNHLNQSTPTYCLGSNSSDIGMIKQGYDSLYKPSMIYHRLLDPYYINQNIFVNSLVNERFNYIFEISSAIPGLSQVAKIQRQKRLWLNMKEEMDAYRSMLFDKLENHEITYIDVIKEYFLRERIYSYYHLKKMPYPSIEEIDKLVENTKVYNSFHEYNELVLKKNTK